MADPQHEFGPQPNHPHHEPGFTHEHGASSPHSRQQPERELTRDRVRAAMRDAHMVLTKAQVPSPLADARMIVQHAARSDRHLLLIDELPDDFDSVLNQCVGRRARREPLQLIMGSAPFRNLQLQVQPGVFIPRPETEVVLDLVHAYARENPLARVVDLCTGSGAIAAAVLDECPQTFVQAVEIDAAAAELAARNLRSVSDPSRFSVHHTSIAEPQLPAALGTCDAVLANPPYIPPDAIPREHEVRAYDPSHALYGGGTDGLQVPRQVLALSARILRPGGLLVIEHADVQGAPMRAAAHELGVFTEIATAPDLTGRDRFLTARLSTPDIPDK